jgi:ACS family hexuronate transporter-like MFS transporter
VWWSLAEMLPPFTRSGLSLGASRFLLGFGEAGNYVAAPKAIAEHFGPANRALAIGIYTAGATMGAAIAPPLVSQVSSRYGWPMVFFVTGLAGLAWVLPWLWIHRRLGQQLPDSLPSTEDPIARASHTASGRGWSAILSQPQTWWLLVARFLTDPVWYFYLFWYPKYLQQSRHLSLSQTGHSAWVVYLAADVGTILGGWIALPLIRAGMQTLAVRRGVMTVAASAMLLSPLIVVVSSIRPMLGIASVIVFSHMAWLVTLTATILDRYPSSVVGVATGIIAAGSGLGGMLSSEIISAIVMHSGYTPLFWGMSLLHPLALIFYWKLKPLRPAKAESSLFQPSNALV